MDNSQNVVLNAAAGSDLDKMHQSFSADIHQRYVANVKAQTIPVKVANRIRYVHYRNNTYACKNLKVTSDAVLHMKNCVKQK